MKPQNFFGELKRRNVYRVVVAYAVVGWLLIQIATQVFPFFEIPNWAVRLVVLLVALGLPVALILAWAFELTPEGIKRAEDVPAERSVPGAKGRKLDFFIIAVLVAAVALLVFDRWRRREAATTSPEDRSIAVLPFQNLSRDPDNAFFADGVQDEILTDLARVAELKVISRTSVLQYKTDRPRNLREIGQQLGVAHVLEGSVQRAGNRVRVNAQLVDARIDRHVWAETYDRDLADVFAIQSEIAKSIARELRAKLSPGEKEAIERPATTDVAALDLYMRARTLTLATGFSADASGALHQAVQLLG